MMDKDALRDYLLTNELGLYALHLAMFCHKYQKWKNQLFYYCIDDLKKYSHAITMGFPCGDPDNEIIYIIKNFFPDWYSEIKHEPFSKVLDYIKKTIYIDGFLIKAGEK